MVNSCLCVCFVQFSRSLGEFWFPQEDGTETSPCWTAGCEGPAVLQNQEPFHLIMETGPAPAWVAVTTPARVLKRAETVPFAWTTGSGYRIRILRSMNRSLVLPGGAGTVSAGHTVQCGPLSWEGGRLPLWGSDRDRRRRGLTHLLNTFTWCTSGAELKGPAGLTCAGTRTGGSATRGGAGPARQP